MSVFPGVAIGLAQIQAGRIEIDRLPLLANHRGTHPDLILRWNDMTSAVTSVDVVVHLHGYSGHGESMRLDLHKEGISGLDFQNPDGAGSSARTRPTLAILPRGNFFGGRSGMGYNFPALTTRNGLNALIEYSLNAFASRNSLSGLTRGRLIITAHSGGGAPLMRILQYHDPEEVHVFDGLYQDASSLIQWAQNRIQRDTTALEGGSNRLPAQYMPAQGGSLRVFFRPSSQPGQGTQGNSLAVHRALCAALPGSASPAAPLANWYRMEQTSVAHNDIPRRYGWALLVDAAADVPQTTRPACQPGAGQPQAGRSGSARNEAAEDYIPAGGRAYNPASFAFRCQPDPATVTSAANLPAPTNDPDAAIQAALSSAGLNARQITQFQTAGGFDALRPIASIFGATLSELLRRLRYSVQQITQPPFTDNSERDTLRRLGVRHRAALLAPRLLLVVPGHFRELARRAPTPQEAYALENFGWLLMGWLRGEIARLGGANWWVPNPPVFVTPFPNPLPPIGPDWVQLILTTGLIDTTLSLGDFLARFNAWDQGLPGRAWRLETGLTNSTLGAGQPFYPQLVNLPTDVSLTQAIQQVNQAWTQRVQQADQQHPNDEEARTRSLTRCDNAPLNALHVLDQASLQGLQIVYDYPALSNTRLLSQLNVLGGIRPVVEQVFETINNLGWNDLLYECAGAACFRGVKLRNPQRHHQAARRMSNHSLGIALDFNTQENGKNIAGSMDPRIVAVFETFHFRWGKCFPEADPMHFEYCGSGC